MVLAQNLLLCIALTRDNSLRPLCHFEERPPSFRQARNAMDAEKLVHRSHFNISGRDYEVLVFCRSDGSHVAKTYFTPDDVIINDGPSLDHVLNKHQRLLPLAVNSRHILEEFRRET